jgi:Cys-rich four helix bundle protein (predicted Tat secretion target)
MRTRRDVITTAALASAALYVSRDASAAAPPARTDTKDVFTESADSAAACVRAGDACIAHCIDELGRGNTAMANCNARVHEMLAFTNAMATLAALKSDMAKKLAPVCADACKTCADACLEHKAHWAHGMHLACQACYEACVTCEKSCRKLATA